MAKIAINSITGDGNFLLIPWAACNFIATCRRDLQAISISQAPLSCAHNPKQQSFQISAELKGGRGTCK